jgi:hypothetical protein
MEPSSEWPFNVDVYSSPSCSSSSGGVNDMGNVPTMCKNDLTSVHVKMRPGVMECLSARADKCKIPMHNFSSLDYDFSIEECYGLWAAPMWMTPDKWQWNGGSGEIDSIEFCPRSGMYTNFAGGGHQLEAPVEYSPRHGAGHATVRKDTEGIITVKLCSFGEAQSNNGQCLKPAYENCAVCQNSSEYACYCNPPLNIYGSGGCQNGGDCLWTLVSDVWNGVFSWSNYYCMGPIPELGLGHCEPYLNTTCGYSIENIRLRGNGPNGNLRFSDGSPESCNVLTPSVPK